MVSSYVLLSVYGPASLDMLTRVMLVVPTSGVASALLVFLCKGRVLDLGKKQDAPPESISRKLTASAVQGIIPEQVKTAVVEGNVDRIRSVMDAGINVNACGSDGKTMLHTAAEMGHAECVRLLLNHQDNRAELDARDGDGRTPLHLAAANGQGVIVKVLLEWGAQLDARDLKGLTPLEHAQQTAHRGCELLMRRALTHPLSKAHADKLTQRHNISASPV